MMNDKDRALAIVTGSSSGIGHATALELIRRGWRIIGISRQPGDIQHAAFEHLDLDLAEIESLPSRIDTTLGPLVSEQNPDRLALVNSAASPGLLGTIRDTDPLEMLRVYAINLVAPAALMGYLARQDGVTHRMVVNLSSGAAEAPFPGISAYCGTKVALKMTGQVLAAEIDLASSGEGFHVHSYDPGPVDTPMQTRARNTSAEVLPIVGVFEQFASQGMLSKPEDHAVAIADVLESRPHSTFTEQRYYAAPPPGE
jgi:benzil reductase ((S)-benzoin forming)